MSGFRRLPATRGAAWLVDGLLALRRAPGPYLGACLLVGLLATLPVVGLFAGLLMPVLSGGLLALLRTRADGGTGRVNQAFAGFTTPGALPRLLPLVTFRLLFVIAVVAIVTVAAGPTLAAFAETAQAGGKPSPAQTMELLARIAPPLLAIAPLGFFVGWVLMLAIPRAMLDGVPGGTALKQAAAAVWANLGAFVVNLACLLAVLAAVVFAMAVPAVAIGGLQATAPGLAMALQVLLMASLTAVVQAVDAAMMFQAAREVFPAAEAEAPPLAAIEA